MLKKNVVLATVAIFTKVAAQGLTAALCLTVCFVATAQVSHAQTTYYRNSPGDGGAVERGYSYYAWASSGFVGEGFLQSNGDPETAYAYWNSAKDGFQVSKGLNTSQTGPALVTTPHA